MQKIICLFGFAVLLTLPAHARLGETEDQCIARYGPIISRTTVNNAGLDLPLLVFEKNGYALSTAMLDGKAAMVVVKKADGTEFSENELTLFLATESAGQKWSKADVMSVNTVWSRDDGAQAQYNPLTHILIIVSKEFIAAREAAEKTMEAKKTQGF